MKELDDLVIDNNAGLLPGKEGSMADVFRAYADYAADTDTGNIRIDIGSGWLFLSGFRETEDAFRKFANDAELAELSDDDWGTTSPIRVVMGGETNQETKSHLTELLRDDLTTFEDSTLSLLAELVQSNLIDFRIIADRSFHAKVYNFYFGSAIPDDTWNGSANFTQPGLTTNIELTVPMASTFAQRQQMRGWFDALWEAGVADISVLDILEDVRDVDHVRYPPKIFFSKMVNLLGKEYLLEDAPGASDDLLLESQDLSYNIVMNRLQKYGGYILANSVGTGKTYVASQVASTYLHLQSAKRVLVVAPANVTEEWENTLNEFGVGEQVDVVSMGNFEKPHRLDANDPSYRFDERDYAEKYSLIVVDEAHNYRNDSNRRQNLEEVLISNPRAQALMTTATPINLSPDDLFQLIDLFRNGRRQDLFENSGFNRHYEKTRRQFKALDDYNEFSHELLEDIKQIEEELSIKLTWRIIAREFEEDITTIAGEDATYEDPDVEELSYEYPVSYRTNIFDSIIDFLRDLSYEPAKFWSGSGYQESRNLIFIQKWQLYKRLESSVAAFHESVRNLNDRNIIYLQILKNYHAIEERTPQEVVQRISAARYRELMATRDEQIHNMVTTFDELDSDTRRGILQRIEADISRTEEMLDLIERYAGSIGEAPRPGDAKIELLAETVEDALQNDQPLLIFSEYSTTVEYLSASLKQLLPEDADRIDYIHGTKGIDKRDFVQRFQQGEFDVAITTEMLSEGVNIPRSDVVVNFDLPYNPTELIQRTGRALRITNPKKVYVKNFTPAESIDQELELYETLDVRLDTIVQIAGLDFVVWMMQDEQIETLHENERDEYLRHLDEYKNKLGEQNPEKVVDTRESIGLEKTDRILRDTIRKYSIDTDLLEQTSGVPRTPIYTVLRGDQDSDDFPEDMLTVLGQSGDSIRLWTELGESIQPAERSDSISITPGDEAVLEELATQEKEDLVREQMAAGNLGRNESQLIDLIRDAMSRLEDQEMIAVLEDVRRGVENNRFTAAQTDKISEACELIDSYTSMAKTIDDAIRKRDAWDDLVGLSEVTSSGQSPEVDPVAIIKYVGTSNIE